jgi:hypothetical protein
MPLLSKSVERRLDRSARKVAASGRTEHVEFTRSPLDVLLMRDRIEAAHKDRDEDAGRPSDLANHPAALAFWHMVYNVGAAAGELEVATLWVGGELAAYTVAFASPPVYAVFDSRMVTRWAPFSPGRRLEKKVLDRAVGDLAYKIVDWMLPGEDGLIGFTEKDPRLAVTAAAGPL